MNSTTVSDSPVDLEKAGLKEVAEEEEVDSLKANLIKCLSDAFVVFYVLFFTGLVAFMVKVSDNWWDPWPGYLILLPIIIGTFWLIPKTKNLYIKIYATKMSQGSGDHLSTKLLASEK